MTTPQRDPGLRSTPATARWVTGASVVAIALATLRPSAAGPELTHFCLACSSYAGVDAVLNLLLFVPLGVGLALFGVRAPAAIVLVFAYSAAIEALQFVAIAGRHASGVDVVSNTLGGALGLLLGRWLPALVRPDPALAGRLAAGWLGLWLGVQLLVAYSLTPVFPNPPYYGQIDRPASESRAAFPGEVLRAGLADEPLSRGLLANAARLKELLRRPEGAWLRATVTLPGEATSDRAEIVVISGPEMTGIASLEQKGVDLIFGVRTGADALRLRPLDFRVRDVFGAGPADRSGKAGTLVVQGRYGHTDVTAGTVSRTRSFTPRLSHGWILFAPTKTYIDGDAVEFLMASAFLALLVLPAGFWGYGNWRVRVRDGRRRRTLPIASGVLLATGLVVVPASFHLRPAALWEWGFVILGVGLGALLARTLATKSAERGS